MGLLSRAAARANEIGQEADHTDYFIWLMVDTTFDDWVGAAEKQRTCVKDNCCFDSTRTRGHATGCVCMHRLYACTRETEARTVAQRHNSSIRREARW